MSSPTTSAASCSAAPSRHEAELADDAPVKLFKHSRLVLLLDRFAPPLAFAALLLVWEAAAWLFAIPSFLLPAPSAILQALLATPLPVWLGHIWATLRVALMGYALAILVSVPLAVGLASSRLLSRTLYPTLCWWWCNRRRSWRWRRSSW